MKRALALALLGLALLAPSALAGRIEGTVRPIGIAEETEVCVVEEKPSETCAVPTADGSYTLVELTLGPQRVEFLPSFRSGLIPQYYNHKNRLSEAATISLSKENATAVAVDADLIAGGVITGEVTAEDGAGALTEVEVCAKSTTTPPVRSCSETGSSGGYELHSLPAGNYKVGFWGRGSSAGYRSQYYAGMASFAQATPIPIANGGEAGGIDAELARGSEISGNLRAASSGSTLPGISVCLFAAPTFGPEWCTYSDATGSYRFQGLPSGSYQVGFSLGVAEIGGEAVAGEEDGFLTQYFAGVANRGEARTISLIAPQAAMGIDASLLAPAPPVPVVPTVVTTALTPAPPPVAVPPTKKNCKKGYRKRKVKGKTRCVKLPSKRHHKQAKHKAREQEMRASLFRAWGRTIPRSQARDAVAPCSILASRWPSAKR